MATGYNFGGGTSSGAGTYSFGGSGKAFNLPSLSPTQQAQVQALQTKQGSKSLLGSIEAAPGQLWNGTTSALGTALNYLGRPAAALDTGWTQEALHRGQGLKSLEAFVHGAGQGIHGKSHDTFSDVIRAAFPKFADNHKVVTALGGFAGTVLTDPTLPLIVGAQAIPGVNVGVDEAEAARLASIMGTAADSAGKVEQAQKALDVFGKLAPDVLTKDFTARKALAQLELQSAHDELAGKAPNFLTEALKSTTSAAAKVEAEQRVQKVLQLQYAVPFTGGKALKLTPTTIAGLRVAPRVPSLKGVAEAGIPAVSKTADALGKAFKHGWGAEDYAKPALAATTHAKQLFHSNLFHQANALVGPHFKQLTADEMLHAINYGETRDGIVRGSSKGRTLNVGMLNKSVRHGELSAKQGAFLADWHTAMEQMRQQEVEAGIVHSGSIGNHVYTPHRVLREGGVVTKVPIKEGTAFGLSKERQNLTLMNLKAAFDAGRGMEKGLSLVTDPAEILGRRVQESADAQSQMVLNRVLAHTAGVPSKIPDVERKALAIQRVRALMKKQRGLTHIVNQRGTRIAIGRQSQLAMKKATTAILARHQPKLDAIDKEISMHMAAVAKSTNRAPAFTQARAMSAKTFKTAIAHFTPQDRVAAGRVHGLASEGKSLEGRLARLGKPRGGSQRAAKVLAADVQDYVKRTGGLGKDLAPSARGESWRSNIKAALDSGRTNVRGQYNDLTKKYQAGDAFDHGKAVKRLTAKRERVMTKAAGQINTARKRVEAQRVTAEEEWQKKFDTQYRLHNSYQRQINKEQRAYGTMKNNPHIPEGWLQLDKNLGDGKYHFDPEIHAAMTHQERAMSNPGVMQSVINGWRTLMGAWKISVTSVNPGYRFRNTASDVWNMYIAGIPMPRVVQYGKKAAVLQRLAHSAGLKLAKGETDLTDSELSAIRAMTEMHLHGILSGLFQGDVEQAIRMFNQGHRARDFLNGIDPRGLGKAYVQMALDVNRHVENWGRITHYLYRRNYQHMSAQASADWVKKAHFDYQELTPFEQNGMKQVFPFYTWTRKDIPYQLSQMFSRPGKYAAFGQAVQSSNELATGNPHTPDAQQALMPTWMRDNYMFRVPGFGANAYVNPNIGVQDLSSVEHPWSQGVLQHLNPALQVLAAAETGKNPGTGQDISGGSHPRNPVSGIAADILGAIPGNPANVGPTERVVRGQETQGPGASPWATFIAGQLPLGNLLVSGTSSIKAKQRGGLSKSIGGYLSGVSVYNRDLPSEQTAAQLAFAAEMKKRVRGLRDTHALPEAQPKKVSPFQAAINQMITQKGG